MILLTLDDIETRHNLPAETARTYGRHFALFLSAVREGGAVRYTEDAATLLAEIHQAVEAGATLAEIEVSLQSHVPAMTVGPVDHDRADNASPAVVSQVKTLLDEHVAAIRGMIADRGPAPDSAPLDGPLQHLREEIAALTSALHERDARGEHRQAVLTAELKDALSAVADQLDELNAEMHDDRVIWRGLIELLAGGGLQRAVIDDAALDAAATLGSQRASRRTPRRMGQPMRANGHPSS